MTATTLRHHVPPEMSLAVDPTTTAVSPVADSTHNDRLQEIYRQHAAFVWRALRALGVREADLEDLTHDVFLVVHRKLDAFEGRSKITTWLFAIAERVASDHRRSARARREELSDAPESEHVPSDEPDAEARALERQARSMLNTILDGMPIEQRVAFVMFELDGLPAEEVASIVGVSVNTVYSRIRLARRHFGQTMQRLRARGWP